MKRTQVVASIAVVVLGPLGACGGEPMVAVGQQAGDRDCPLGTTRPVADVAFEITRGGQTVTVPTLRDNLRQGDQVAAVFSIASGCQDVEVTLASHTAPNPDDATEVLQDLHGVDTGVFNEGTHRLQVDVPTCFFQVALAYGPPVRDPSTEDVYGSRTIDADVGGHQACAEVPAGGPSSSEGADGCAAAGMVGVCHRTNASDTHWEFICVDASAVADHQAHGDAMGETRDACEARNGQPGKGGDG